jgi:hypothetical protein
MNRFRDWLFKGAREACAAPDKPQTPPSSETASGGAAGAWPELGPLFTLLLAVAELHELVELDGAPGANRGLHL